MDFTLPQDIDDIARRTAQFVDEEILPLEADSDNYDAHENISLELLAQMRDKAKEKGLWAPQAPVDRGGMGLPVMGWAAMYEQANRSIFGPVIMNCAAPDDGNINLLSKIGTDAQKEWFLDPIISGEVRSSFDDRATSGQWLRPLNDAD